MYSGDRDEWVWVSKVCGKSTVMESLDLKVRLKFRIVSKF